MNDRITDEIDLYNVIGIISKNLLWIIGITFLFMTTILIICIISIKLPPEKSFLPNTFTPRSYVMLNSSSSQGDLNSLLASSGLSSIAGIAGLSSSSSATSDSELAIKIATTNSFIEKLDKTFNLAERYDIKDSNSPKTDLRNIVKSKLKIEIEEGTNFLIISYTDIDKQIAVDIVNKAVDLLEEEFFKIDKEKNINQTLLVEEKKAIVESDINKIQTEIVNFQIENNLFDVKIISEELVKLISGLQAQLLDKEVQIESYGKVTNVKDPIYQRLVNEREAIKKAIIKLENGEVSDYPPIDDLPVLSLSLEKLKRRLEVKLIGYKALIQQEETLKLTAEGTGPTFQVLERAEVPELKSGPSRSRLCILVTFTGFFISIIFVFLKEAWLKIKDDPIKMKKLKGRK